MSVAALVLAAGLSTRMGPRNKLLVTDAWGQAMIARVAASALASRADPVVVVTGHQAEAVAASLHNLPGRALQLIFAGAYAQGMSASLKAGIAALPGGVDGALICLGDMPLIGPALLDRMIEVFEAAARPAIVVPLCGGMRGNPVLWDRSFFGAFENLWGDQGARTLLDRFAADVLTLETGDDAVLRDFDTPEAFG
jgi:molybdenum cofactor cytidylyltransferase